MMSIYKYPIELQEYQEIEMPAGAEILCVQVQQSNPCVWAMFDVQHEENLVARKICVFGTGSPIEKDRRYYKYLGTGQLHNGNFVFHVFEYLG